MSIIGEIIRHLSTKLATENSKNILQVKYKIITEELIHNKFVVVRRLAVMLSLSSKNTMLRNGIRTHNHLLRKRTVWLNG